MTSKEHLISMLNQALELEHAAYLQYLSHAELIDGLNALPIIEKIKEITGDEQKHAEQFRNLIGDFFGEVPSMAVAPVKSAKNIKQILEVNLKAEMDAIEFYKKILASLKNEKLEYSDLYVEHAVRHIIIDEMEHVSELKLLLAMR
jgi:bacterioferritin (cytochrome b1)